jgi:hypothetical protein
LHPEPCPTAKEEGEGESEREGKVGGEGRRGEKRCTANLVATCFACFFSSSSHPEPNHTVTPSWVIRMNASRELSEALFAGTSIARVVILKRVKKGNM